MSREAHPGPVPGGTGGGRPGGNRTPRAGARAAAGRPRRPSLGGGLPAQDRELRAQGRQTVSRLLEAALAEFDERGFQQVRVDDIVRRAQTSHGTFYLYFANKEDIFKALLRDALSDMQAISDDFPVVTRNEAGREALRRWVDRFCGNYAAHAAVIRVLSQAEIVGEEVWGDGLRLLFRLAESMALGMTAASRAPQRGSLDEARAAAPGGTAARTGPAEPAAAGPLGGLAGPDELAGRANPDGLPGRANADEPADRGDGEQRPSGNRDEPRGRADRDQLPGSGDREEFSGPVHRDEPPGRRDPEELTGQGELAGHAELTALACLMMLERVNYLLSVEVRLPKDEMVDRITAIMFAAFHAA